MIWCKSPGASLPSTVLLCCCSGPCLKGLCHTSGTASASPHSLLTCWPPRGNTLEAGLSHDSPQEIVTDLLRSLHEVALWLSPAGGDNYELSAPSVWNFPWGSVPMVVKEVEMTSASEEHRHVPLGTVEGFGFY